jgi:hypothetical protein
MATIVLTLRGGAIASQRVRLRDRLAARWRARRLDRELAAGAEPDADVLRTLRAAALIAPAERSMLARSLRRILRDADDRRAAVVRRAPVRRRTALGAAEELDALARRLVSPQPVTARGVALVGRLLGDAASPLYSGLADELRGAALRALAALEPYPERTS